MTNTTFVINKEGLTWKEWYTAAGYTEEEQHLLWFNSYIEWEKLAIAYQHGEDPTEYRAEKEATK